MFTAVYWMTGIKDREGGTVEGFNAKEVVGKAKGTGEPVA